MRLVTSGLVLMLLGVARPAAAQRVDVDALPRGELLGVPTSRPSRVSGAKSGEGLWLSVAPRRNPEDQYSSLTVWDDQRAAEHFARGDYRYMSAREPSSCFMAEQAQAQAETQGRWPLSAMSYAQITVHFPRGESAASASMYPTLHAIRVERLNRTDAGASLDVTDLWVDSNAAAMRVIERRRIALQRVADLEPGATVFAARGTDAVHFVIAASDRRFATLRERLGGSRMTLERGAEQGSVDCAHATLTLRAPAGAGETATAKLKVVTELTAKPRVSEGSIGAVVRVLGSQRKPGTLEDFSGEVTIRTLAVHVSAGRTRADRPLSASVAFQWTKDLEKRDL